ncbi:MAG TPA: integration host factor, actinobacterial type [Acidimicrobiia bacterium]|jgi:hypothetical protein
MAPPELTPEQRKAALQKAAEARRARAELKELLRTGSLSLAEVLDRAESDEIVAGTKVSAVLMSMPGLGKVKAKRLMEANGIAENRRIRGLGQRQRAALLDRFS